MPSVQNGSVEDVVSILAKLEEQVTSAETQQPASKPVSQTSKTGTSDTRRTQESTEGENENAISKPVSDAGKSGFETGSAELEVEEGRVSENRSDHISGRKRKSGNKTESLTERKRAKTDGEGVGQRSTSEPPLEPEGRGCGVKEAEFDAGVLTETGVNNSNILHVCCNGLIGGTSPKDLGQQRLVILDRILSSKPVRPVIARLVSE